MTDRLRAQYTQTLVRGVAMNFIGAWPTAAPGPTSGTAVVLPAGVLRAQVNVTQFSASQTGLQVSAYVDGNLVATARLDATHAINEHVPLWSPTFTLAVTAGTHFVYLRQILGSSASTDYASLFGIVTPT